MHKCIIKIHVSWKVGKYFPNWSTCIRISQFFFLVYTEVHQGYEMVERSVIHLSTCNKPIYNFEAPLQVILAGDGRVANREGSLPICHLPYMSGFLCLLCEGLGLS